MKSHGLPVAVGISFVTLAILLAGCPLPEADIFPDGELRPPGGEPIPATGSSGGGGTGGAGGTGGGTGGTGGGVTCGDNEVDEDKKEQCDDGNQFDEDGCSSICQVEECWNCLSGTCMPLAPNALCNNGAQVCDGKGGCGDCVPIDMACDNCKNCGNYTCDNADDCASKACVTGICRSADGSICSDAVECATDYCKSGFCAECTGNAQCTSGSCDSSKGRCLAAVGEPCDEKPQCASGLDCIMNICKGLEGAKCVGDYQCVSNRCLLGTCALCGGNPDCTFGMCKSGSCPSMTFPPGAYCVINEDCASDVCTGFPRRCM